MQRTPLRVAKKQAAPKDVSKEQQLADLKHHVLKSRDSLHHSAVAKSLKVTREVLRTKVEKNEVLGLTLDEKIYRYPSWQFSESIAPALGELLKSLKGMDAWEKYMFFTETNKTLKVSPLEALKANRIDEVKEVAKKAK
jgi:hypothetical protein